MGRKHDKDERKSHRRGAKRHRREKPEKVLVRDKHVLYEASVQSPGEDLRFFERIFRRRAGRPMRDFREDFCGTSLLSCTFVGRHAENRAWGIDLHGPTLEWGRKHHVARLGTDASRLTLLQDDVLRVKTPKVDVSCALNFSYWIFHERATLVKYFKRARAALKHDGLFFLDAFGGQDSMGKTDEERRITGQLDHEGRKIRAFTYTWDQARFNVIDHRILCHIHFKLADGTRMKKAFTYDWRMWTFPELRDMLLEAGFSDTEAYLEGWDDEEDEADGIFRRRSFFANQLGWVGYMVGVV